MQFGLLYETQRPFEGTNIDWNTLYKETLEQCELADRVGFDNLWFVEHHFLMGFSGSPCPEVLFGALSQRTKRIRIGFGVSILPYHHPVRVAERVAMLDHLSEGRFEFGSGRGAGSHELGTFNIDPGETKANWDEVIWEFTKMWDSFDYSHDGTAFSSPPRNVVPKPYGGGRTHPPMWVAAGNPPTYEKAARHGLGVLGFNVAAIHDMKEHVDAYKSAIDEATPAGRYVNDNVMITNGLVCLEDGREAREAACNMQISYLQSLVFLYHDTFPVPEGFTAWPNVMPEPTLDDIEGRIEAGFLLCGDPDEVTEQVRRYQAVGCDQVAFGLPVGLPQPLAIETLRLFGQEVIPKFDHDPVHRSSRMRTGEPALRA
jgi:alkanesulfonate monooxygenase SsuD/methylene tetrahydromethanopterin reductase-like flavin-dependent oxidoreductase (luciferase family)